MFSVEDLAQRVKGMFRFPEWHTFVERTRRALPRYVRDQCVLARRYFSNGLEEGLFYEAVGVSLYRVREPYRRFKPRVFGDILLW